MENIEGLVVNSWPGLSKPDAKEVTYIQIRNPRNDQVKTYFCFGKHQVTGKYLKAEVGTRILVNECREIEGYRSLDKNNSPVA